MAVRVNLVVRFGGVVRLAEVRLQDGVTLENAPRRFKRKVQQEDIIKEVKRHPFYLKPGEKLRVGRKLARKRNRKKSRRGNLATLTWRGENGVRLVPFLRGQQAGRHAAGISGSAGERMDCGTDFVFTERVRQQFYHEEEFQE